MPSTRSLSSSLKKMLLKVSSKTKTHVEYPEEFICPISMAPMADPVIVCTGQSYERRCVEAWMALGRTYCYVTGAELKPDSALIPNIALGNAISHWCSRAGVESPKPPDEETALSLVQEIIAKDLETYQAACVPRTKSPSGQGKSESSCSDRYIVTVSSSETSSAHDAGSSSDFGCSPMQASGLFADPALRFTHSEKTINVTGTHPSNMSNTTTVEEVELANPFATKPCCYSSEITEEEAEGSSSNTFEATVSEFIQKLKNPQSIGQEQAVLDLRKITCTNTESRIYLSSPELLAALLPLMVSRYSGIQIHAVAALVNISLENDNKVKIVRAGAVPYLIDALKMGHTEAQLHAAGALFSLALNDDNKTAIGVLGAVPPLLHVLRSEEERAAHDAAMALYHLSFAQSNRTKLIKAGAVPVLLNLAQGQNLGLASRCLIILHNVASASEGRNALLDANGVELLISILAQHHNQQSESSLGIQESTIAVLFLLSRKNIRFKSAAMQAGATEYFIQLAENGSQRSKEKARALLNIMKGLTDNESEESLRIRSHRNTLGWGPASGGNSSEF